MPRLPGALSTTQRRQCLSSLFLAVVVQGMLKKPDVRQLTRNNDVRPFEDPSSLEFLAEKNECAAFLYCSHSKKRPNNLVLVSHWFSSGAPLSN